MTSDNHNPNDHKKDIDEHSGVETTGHEWDGIKELNNPAPRWWLIVLFICIIWGFAYMYFYPAYPTLSGEGERGGTKGSLGWTQYKQLKEQQADIIARKSAYLGRFQNSSFKEIRNNSELYAFSIAGGKSSFKDNCATCHGTGGAGGDGYPNLNDDDWLWGGSIDDIYTTIKYGIRSEHDESRISEMPAFGNMLEKEQITDIASYVANLSTKGTLSKSGTELFAENCASCHGETGTGGRDFGAPNIADSIWLYGENKPNSIATQIKKPRHGIMPAWEGRLDEDTIRQLTIYVHSLGGGE